jgi:hypothetical protein
MKAEIKLKDSCMDESLSYHKAIYEEVDLIESPLLWQERGLSYTASGYGAKIPTSKKVKFRGRWHRVYCTIYSNSGSCWIKSKGEKYYVSE